MFSASRIFILLGIIFLVVGGLLLVLGRLNLPFGRLPGDIQIEIGNGSFYFPIATSIILSLLLTILLNFVLRLFRK